ncbi:F-box domain containing protein [Trema orientale]|uniref:F-box domain containing protein n=1 Tax=Trema orientale TaxID=63057 RepID=A0A2P5BIH0_TREOI|nr:F-box domain containing protein [Trema orientale]
MATTPSSSYLPEPVIHKILKRLPPKDAIRASATSKPWRLAWITSPVLAFDESIVPFKHSDFFDYVDRSLALWRDRCDNRVNMEKFTLCADVTTEEFFSRLVELVAIATSRSVKVIKLRSCSERFYMVFHSDSLWPLLSACKSFDVLSLRGFQLCLWGSLPEMSSVKKLSLAALFIDENGLKNLLSSLPLLEDLDIGFCLGFVELRISCPKLRTFEVILSENPPQNVVINAPNLQYFLYQRSSYPLGSVGFSNCKLLTTLRIERTEFGTANALDEHLSQIPLLENLMVKACRLREGIRISHSNLKSLTLQHNWRLKKAEIDTPNLRFFKYVGGIFHVSTFRYSSGLLKAELRLASSVFDCTEWFWFIRLRNFLESFSNCKILSLHCYLEGCAEELRDSDMLPDPFYELTHLSISNLSLPITQYSSFLKAMVEIFPGLETLFLETMEARISIEFDEYRYLNWNATVYSSNNDERDKICESIKGATNKILELFGWTDEHYSENESDASIYSDLNNDMNIYAANPHGALDIAL